MKKAAPAVTEAASIESQVTGESTMVDGNWRAIAKQGGLSWR